MRAGCSEKHLSNFLQIVLGTMNVGWPRKLEQKEMSVEEKIRRFFPDPTPTDTIYEYFVTNMV